VGLYLLRVLVRPNRTWQRWAIVLTGTALAAVFWYANSELLLRLLPAGINLTLAVFFAWGVMRPPALPTRMAALQHGVPATELPEPIVRYTRAVALLWTCFFLFNATLATLTALVTSRELWALYNGLVAYGLVGTVFAAEYAYRRLIFYKKHPL
jgi:uncharacterized membrane protein